jgi:hypothetical protein
VRATTTGRKDAANKNGGVAMKALLAMTSLAMVLAVAGLVGATEMDPEKDEWLDSFEDDEEVLWDILRSLDGTVYAVQVVETEEGLEYGIDAGLIVQLTPDHFWYRKNTSYYHFYMDDEEFDFLGTCGSRCLKWGAEVTGYPQDVDEIWGKATTPSDTNYCDNDYTAWWWDKGIYPDGAWDEAETDNCNYVFSNPSYYAYYTGEDLEIENYDYGSGTDKRILRWKYRASDGNLWQVRLYFTLVPQ